MGNNLFDSPVTEVVCDFWCIVCIDENDCVWVMKRSEDVILRDVMEEFSGEDNGLSDIWQKDQPPGIYRLQLNPWAHQGYEGEWDNGIDVIQWDQLFVIP